MAAFFRPSPQRLCVWFGLLVMAGAIVITFYPVLAYDFLNWDDPVNFLKNQSFRGLGWAQIAWAFQTGLLGTYQPLSWLFASLQYTLWGLNPWGYHAASLFLHVLNSFVLYRMILLLLDTRGLNGTAAKVAALCASLLFALHPLRVEVVAWISAQFYLFGTLWLMLTVMAYVQYWRQPEKRSGSYLRWVLPLYIIAALAKPIAVGLPLVLIVLDAYPLGRLTEGGVFSWRKLRRSFVEKWPLFGVSLATIAAGIWARSAVIRGASLFEGLDPGLDLVQAGYTLFHYLLKTFLPLGLSGYYVAPSTEITYHPQFLATAACSILITGLLWGLRRRMPAALAAWGIYLIFMVPHVGILWKGLQLLADRYSYVATLSWYVVLAAAIAVFWQARMATLWWRLGISAATIAAAISLSVSSRALGEDWASNAHFWSAAEKTYRESWQSALPNPSAAHLYFMLGLVADEKQDQAEAKSLYQKSLAINPGLPKPRMALAGILMAEGLVEEATAEMRKVTELTPSFATGHFVLAQILDTQGLQEEALAEFQEAVRYEPQSFTANTALGFHLLTMNRAAEAVLAFEKALSVKKDFSAALDGLEKARKALPKE